MLGTVVALFCVLFLGSRGPDEPNDSLLIHPGTGDSTLPFFRVLGSDLTTFRGQIGDSRGNRSVDGTVPQDYVLENARDYVVDTFTKMGRGRQVLIAQVFVGGQLQSQQETNVVGGSVTVTASVATSQPQ